VQLLHLYPSTIIRFLSRFERVSIQVQRIAIRYQIHETYEMLGLTIAQLVSWFQGR